MSTAVALLAERLYTRQELKELHDRYVDNKGGNRSKLELIGSLMLHDTERFWNRLKIDTDTYDEEFESSRTFPVSRRPSLEDLTTVYYLAFGLDGSGKSEDELYGDFLNKQKGLQPSWFSLELSEELGGDGLGWLVHLKPNVLKEMCKQMDVSIYGIAKDPAALAIKIRISGGPNKPALRVACRLSELPVGGNMEELAARLKATTAQTLALDSQSNVPKVSVPRLREWAWEEDILHAVVYGKAGVKDGEPTNTSRVVAKGTVMEMSSLKATAGDLRILLPAAGTLTLSDGDAILTESGSIYVVREPAPVAPGFSVSAVKNAGNATHNTLNLKFTMPLAGNEMEDVQLLWRYTPCGARYNFVSIPPENWRDEHAQGTFQHSFSEVFEPSKRYELRMRVVHKGKKYETPFDKALTAQTRPAPGGKRKREPDPSQPDPQPDPLKQKTGLFSWVLSFFRSAAPAIPGTAIPEEYQESAKEVKQEMLAAQKEEIKAAKQAVKSEYAPPGPVAMRARLCALNFDLIEAMKAKFHNREIAAGEITKWFKQNPEHLEGTGLSVEDVSTDHILPRSVGGHHHVFNYYIMPRSHNSHFYENWSAEKRAYIGKQGVKLAQGFAGWCRDKSDIQYFNFKPDNYLLSE